MYGKMDDMSRSLKLYDEKLMEDDHFKIHSEMLPYIGSKYVEQKILVISESHFVPISNNNIPSDNEWYNPKDIDFLLHSIEYNTFTREIIEKFFSEKKSHRLFLNINNALKETKLILGIENIAWYNFFQKPAFNKDSIKPTRIDCEIAERVFEKVIETLNPNLIILTSVKSFNFILPNLKWIDEKQAYNYKNFPFKIDFVAHPNSNWWNRKSLKYSIKNTNQPRTGRQKFIDFVNGSEN